MGRFEEAEADQKTGQSRLSGLGAKVPTSSFIIEKFAYLVAALLGLALLIGIGSMMGVVGVATLLGAALFVWGIKWGWLWFLK